MQEPILYITEITNDTTHTTHVEDINRWKFTTDLTVKNVYFRGGMSDTEFERM